MYYFLINKVLEGGEFVLFIEFILKKERILPSVLWGSLASLDKVHEREAASKTHHKWTPNLLTQLLNLFSCLTITTTATDQTLETEHHKEYVSYILQVCVGLQCKRHLIENKVLWGDEQK